MEKNIHSSLHLGEAKNKINMRIHLSRGKHTELYEQIIESTPTRTYTNNNKSIISDASLLPGWGDSQIKRTGVLFENFGKNHYEVTRSCFVGAA